MTAAINSTAAGKRGYPTKSSVPYTQAATQRRARERSVAIQTLLLVRKSKSSSVKSKRSEERFSRNAETDLVCRLLLEKKKPASYAVDQLRGDGLCRSYVHRRRLECGKRNVRL